MTLNSSLSNTESDLHQRSPAASDLILAAILRGDPLVQILVQIVKSIEDRHSHIQGAIFLLDQSKNSLLLGAAPSLCQEYSAAVDGMVADIGDELRQQATAAALEITSGQLQASPFWSCFCNQALGYGLHAFSVDPISSADNGMLGMLVAYSPLQNGGKIHWQAPACATALASIAIERDIHKTRVQRAEHTLRESETRMALAIEGSSTGIWDRNVVTGDILYSPGWKAILGYGPSELTTRIEDSYTRVHPEDLASVQATIQAHFDQKTESYTVEHRIRCKDGSYKWIVSRGKVVSRDANGKPLRMIGTTNDITAMRALSDRLQQSVDLITNLTNQVPGFVFQYRLLPDGEAFFSYASEGVRDIYEIAPEQLASNVAYIRDIIHPDDYPIYCASLDASAASLRPWHFEYRVILPRQGLRWRQGDARPRRLPDGSTLWHGYISDVTDRKHIEAELQAFALLDFLTQLPNRRCIMVRMEEELARIRRTDVQSTAVLMCDLDFFKRINDGYGHAIGDLVLKRFSDILSGTLRQNDIAGRIGGEEFAVILPAAGVIEAYCFAERLQSEIAQTSFNEGGVSIPVTVSIGITLMKATDVNAEAALSRSDMALYRAKRNGRNCIQTIVD